MAIACQVVIPMMDMQACRLSWLGIGVQCLVQLSFCGCKEVERSGRVLGVVD